MTGGNCQIRMRFIKKSVKNNCIALFFVFVSKLPFVCGW